MSRSIPEYYNIYAFISVYKLMLYLLEDIIYNIFIYMFVRTVYIYLIEETSLFLDIISLVFSYTIYNLQHSSLTTYLDFIQKGTVNVISNGKVWHIRFTTAPLKPFSHHQFWRHLFFLALKCLILTISSFVSEAELRKYF